MQRIENSSVKNVDLEPIENTAWSSLSNTYKIVYSHIMSDLRQYGLTPPQYTVLRVIGNSREGQTYHERDRERNDSHIRKYNDDRG